MTKYAATITLPHKLWYNLVIYEEKREYGRSTIKSASESLINENTTVHHPHDHGYKYLLSSKRVFLEFLRTFVNMKWVNDIDESQLVKVDKSFILADFRGREADLVYRVKLKGQNTYFYILVELQSTVKPLIPFRVLHYKTEIWRDVLKDAGKKKDRMGFKLPNIIPIVLYNGKRKWTISQQFKDKLEGNDHFDDGVMDFRYLLVDVKRMTDSELKAKGNLIASVFALDQVNELEEIVAKVREWLPVVSQLSDEDQVMYWHWTQHVVGQQLPVEERNEIVDMIAQSNPKEREAMITNIETIVKRSLVKERKEGWEQGIEQGEENIARRLLRNGMSVEQVAEITELAYEQVQKWNE